ncbi:MAG TPA: hypothetical protein ENJ08_05695 [Gammaproteobacteria bacterium]|nr:hypothetical protein [Gammaproteobacteria bacterium]
MNIKPLSLLLTLSLLVACNQQVANESAESGGATATEYNMSSRFVGKPHAAVSMRFILNGPAELNQPLDISLTFTVERDTEMLEVEYRTNAGLQSTDASQQYQFTQLVKGTKQQINIGVVPQQSGLHHINVFATISVDGIRQTRPFAIPVSIEGSTQLQKTGQDESANGMLYLPEQNVISMPAAESP